MSKKNWAIVLGVALLSGLAMFAASRLSISSADPKLVFPKAESSAVAKFRNSQEAAFALMPNVERTIPIGMFKGAKGLQVGVTISADTTSGKRFTGKVVAIGVEQVTVHVESWEDISRPRK